MPIDEVKPKITRSRARHLRRKRLVTARKTAETNSNIEIDRIQKNPSEINGINEIGDITKSKCRRLKKRNNTAACQSQTTSEITEIQSLNSNSCSLSEDLHADTKKTRMELLENEKNWSIHNTQSIDINSTDQCEIDSHNSNPGLIINETTEIADFTLLCNINENVINHKSVSLSDAVASSHNTSTEKVFSHLNKYKPKMDNETKSRDEIKAEREAKKAAKIAAKNKSKNIQQNCVKLLPDESVVEKSMSEKSDGINSEIKRLTNDTSQLSMLNSDKKSANPTTKNEGKSKAELRAERRLKQDAQRTAKQEQLEKAKLKAELPKSTKTATLEIFPSKIDESSSKVVKKIVGKERNHEISLFKHLYHEREQACINLSAVNSNIHPAIIRLGVQYANKIIVGSNARCIALLATVKHLINDFERPAHADFNRGLETSLQESSSYLHHCRPLAVSMHNALRHLKWQMTQLPTTISDDEAKSALSKAIDTYIQEQITLAAEMISIKIRTKISNDDVILTYGFSSLIQKILCDAYDAGRQFRVVVVDGRPWLEGKELLRRLVNHGIECSYVLINALSFIMPEVNKVFLGAYAILANGAVMSRAGTAQVALMAKAFNVPVLVACEMHKSSERVQTDSIVYNEIDDADKLLKNFNGTAKKNPLTNWRMKKSLNLLNITYDVTPADLVTGVVTELAILPCSSVPVILRIKPSEI